MTNDKLASCPILNSRAGCIILRKKDSEVTGQTPWKRVPRSISNVCHRLANGGQRYVDYSLNGPGLDNEQVTCCK